MQAAFSDRDYVIPDDVKSIAGRALAHRILLKPDLLSYAENETTLLTSILDEIEPPAKIPAKIL